MSRLDEVLQTLGPSLLRPLTATDLDVEVSGVAVHDEADPPTLTRGMLVLGVGLGPGRGVLPLMERLAAEGAILALKVPRAGEARAAADAQRLGLSLVGVAPGADWVQLVLLLTSVVRRGAGDRESSGGAAAGDLFAVANAVSAIVDAPVTIEDPQSRVLAYSTRQDEADEARMRTILGRRIPDDFQRSLGAAGVFRRLSQDREPLYLDDIGPGVLPRLVVGVRAGEEVLGSVWAAVRERPDERRVREFADAANFVAIHLLRHRLAADVERSLQAELFAFLVSGGPLAGEAASRLGLAGEAFRVIAAGLRRGDAIDNELALRRAWDALSLHLSAVHRRAVTGLVEGVVYAVVPASGDAAATLRTARQAAEGFVARAPANLRSQLLVGIGRHAVELGELPRSRDAADRVLRLLRGSRRDAASVGAIDDLLTEVLLMRLADLAGEEPLVAEGPLGALVEHDRRHHGWYVATLRAYLEGFGDVIAAARAMGIHQNTFRYRLQKLQAFPGIDLDDPERRLALQLQLRLLTGGEMLPHPPPGDGNESPRQIRGSRRSPRSAQRPR